MSTIYLVMGERGEDSDWEQWPAHAFASKAQAQACADAANDWCRAMLEEYTRRREALQLEPKTMPSDLVSVTDPGVLRERVREERGKAQRELAELHRWYHSQRNPHDTTSGAPEATYDVVGVPFTDA